MKLPLVFRPQADAEFADAAIWYEMQRAGLGHQFISEVEKVLDNIANQPDRYAIVHGDIREAPVLRFPSLRCFIRRAIQQFGNHDASRCGWEGAIWASQGVTGVSFFVQSAGNSSNLPIS